MGSMDTQTQFRETVTLSRRTVALGARGAPCVTTVDYCTLLRFICEYIDVIMGDWRGAKCLQLTPSRP